MRPEIKKEAKKKQKKGRQVNLKQVKTNKRKRLMVALCYNIDQKGGCKMKRLTEHTRNREKSKES